MLLKISSKIKAAQKAASCKADVAEGFASSTFLNTKQAHAWSAFTLGSWYPQRVSFSIRK